MINDALDTVQTEITRYKTKVSRGVALNPTEAKIMQGYIKSLVELSKEDRERARDADLSELSTEELLKLLGGAQKQVGGRTDE
jgi:predicted secreted Zn-dependent protease